MRIHGVLAAFAITAATAFSATAQTGAPEATACNPQFARILVEQQVAESKAVVDPVKRIKILIRSADFLWTPENATSRAYFGEAWKMAVDRFAEKGHERTELGRGISAQLPDQRMEVLRAISKRDSAWARKLSEQMLADYEKTAKDRKSAFDQEREMYELLYLGREVLKTDPELSRFLIRRVMDYPLSQWWFGIFFSLSTDDRGFADAMYLEALTRYRGESPRRLLYLSGYPFGYSNPVGIEKYSVSAFVQAGFSPSPDLQRQFIRTFVTRVASFAASEEDINRPPEKPYMAEPVYMVAAINELEPIVMERFPDLLEPLSMAKAQATALLNADMQKQMDERGSWNKQVSGSFEAALERAEKADSEGKLTDFMVLQLVTWRDKTDAQFAKVESWLDKVKDEKVRKELTNYFWFLRTQLAIKEKRIDDAERLMLKVPEIEHRALLMFEIANIHAKADASSNALFDLLNRLSKLMRPVDASVAKAQVLIGLSSMYEKLNHSVAMEELSEAIRVTNQLKDPDIFANFVRRQITGKDFGHVARFSTPGYNLEKAFEELSKKDFELSLAQARSLDDRYLRTLAVIAVAKNCMQKAPTPKPAPNSKAKSN